MLTMKGIGARICLLFLVRFGWLVQIVQTLPEAAENADLAAVQFGPSEDAPKGVENMVRVAFDQKIKAKQSGPHMLNHALHFRCRGRDSFGR
jgi:hypothetical protein